MHIRFIVRHKPTSSVFGFSSWREANSKAEELNKIYVIANRINKCKAVVITLAAYLKWCESEDLTISESLHFDNK